jgi:hypothetical protein
VPTTSSTPSGSGACELHLDALVGATAECNSCVAESCCAEARAFELAQLTDEWQMLVDCAVSGGQGPCAAACTVRVCEGGLGFQFFMRCADCVNTNCCSSWVPCEADTSCFESCLLAKPPLAPSCCEPGSLYRPIDECAASYCPDECGAASCAAGGAGGGGGASGGAAGGGG